MTGKNKQKSNKVGKTQNGTLLHIPTGIKKSWQIKQKAYILTALAC